MTNKETISRELSETKAHNLWTELRFVKRNLNNTVFQNIQQELNGENHKEGQVEGGKTSSTNQYILCLKFTNVKQQNKHHAHDRLKYHLA